LVRKLTDAGRKHDIGAGMQKIGSSILVSASDLVGHLNCRHLTDLDVAVATGALGKPKVWDDPLLQLLWERGARHEKAFVDHLEAQGFGITLIEGIGVDDRAVGQTRDATTSAMPILQKTNRRKATA
jgi:hypothetical protein